LALIIPSVRSLVKPSIPTRVYLHLTDPGHLTSLSTTVQQANFADARNTSTSASLLGPPVVEFAPFGRIPSAKRRSDARQGTIDQDPEFIAFLESLTNPTNAKKSAGEGSIGADGLGKKEEKVTTTPLIQYLKDKKASKAKEATLPAKGSRARLESRDSRSDKGGEKKILSKSGKEIASLEVKKGTRDRERKVQKAATEAIKVLNREASAAGGKAKVVATLLPPASSAAVGGKDAGSVQSSAAPSAPVAERRRERGNASIAAKILQRDLGLGGTPPRRGGVKREGTSDGTKLESSSQPKASSSPAKQEGPPAADLENARSAEDKTPSEKTPPSGPSSEKESHRKSRSERRARRFSNDKTSLLSRNPPTGPAAPLAILKKSATSVQLQLQRPSPPKGPSSANNPPPSLKSASSAPPVVPTAPKPVASAPTPSAGATQAFCKHANASQGVTEPALREAMEVHGAVVKVEIDKKKGFGYVDFAEPEGLVNAIKAGPLKVGNGSIVVLERKERPSASAGGGSGLADRGRGRASGGINNVGRAGGLEGSGGRGGGRGRGRGRGGPPRGPAASVAGNTQTGSPVSPAATPTATPAATVAPPTGPAAETA
jgi:regulator of nonsense transcripts 3